MIWLKVGLVAALIAAGVFGVQSYNRALKDNATMRGTINTLQQDNKDLIAENQQVRDAKARVDQVLAVRMAERNLQDKIERGIDAALKNAYTQPEARAWRDTAVPLSVLNSVRNGASESPSQNGLRGTAGSADGAKRNTGLAGDHDKRRATGLRAPDAAPGAGMQR